jgi:hypothetical protein
VRAILNSSFGGQDCRVTRAVPASAIAQKSELAVSEWSIRSSAGTTWYPGCENNSPMVGAPTLAVSWRPAANRVLVRAADHELAVESATLNEANLKL